VSIKTTLKFEAIKSNGGAAIQLFAVLVGVTAIINFVIVRELSVTGCMLQGQNVTPVAPGAPGATPTILRVGFHRD